VRIIYFAMLPTGVLNNANVVVFVILGEIPVYLFLSIYTLLLLLWYALDISRYLFVSDYGWGRVDLVHWSLKQGSQKVFKKLKVAFLAINGFFYAFLLVLVIIYIALQASTTSYNVPVTQASQSC